MKKFLSLFLTLTLVLGLCACSSSGNTETTGATEETIDKVEEGIRRAGAVTTMLENGLTPEDILGQVCGDLGVVFMETTEVDYRCYCDRDRVTAALISLGKKELTEIAEEGKTFPVECQFCDHVYEFTPEDIFELLKKV